MGSGCQTGGMVCFQIWHRMLFSIFKVKFTKIFVEAGIWKTLLRLVIGKKSISFLARHSLVHLEKENGVRVDLGSCISEFERTYINNLIREKSFM